MFSKTPTKAVKMSLFRGQAEGALFSKGNINLSHANIEFSRMGAHRVFVNDKIEPHAFLALGQMRLPWLTLKVRLKPRADAWLRARNVRFIPASSTGRRNTF